MTNSLTIEEEAESRLPPPTQSKLSIILNGAGNGAMIAAIPLAAYELYKTVTQRDATSGARPFLTLATVAGAALGAWYGAHEAKQLENYRNQIGEEITRLYRRVDRLEKNHGTSQVEKLAARDAAADSEIGR